MKVVCYKIKTHKREGHCFPIKNLKEGKNLIKYFDSIPKDDHNEKIFKRTIGLYDVQKRIKPKDYYG